MALGVLGVMIWSYYSPRAQLNPTHQLCIEIKAKLKQLSKTKRPYVEVKLTVDEAYAIIAATKATETQRNNPMLRNVVNLLETALMWRGAGR